MRGWGPRDPNDERDPRDERDGGDECSVVVGATDGGTEGDDVSGEGCAGVATAAAEVWSGGSGGGDGSEAADGDVCLPTSGMGWVRSWPKKLRQPVRRMSWAF